jgi:hypothetical protein
MRHFREWEDAERVELIIDGIEQVQDSLHHRKYIFPRQEHREQSAADRQSDDKFVPVDTAECCSVSVALHLAERTPLIP